MLYILAVEDNPDLLDLYSITLSRSFPHEVVLARSAKEAIEVMRTRGAPAVMITDDKMPGGDGIGIIEWMKSSDLAAPYILSSATPESQLRAKYPEAYGYLLKPKVSAALFEMVGDVLSGQKTLLNYIPVNISLLLKLGIVEFPLFMKLSYSKYVKVLKEGETFIISDAERFWEKQLTHLYISAVDAAKFLESFEKNLDMVMNSESLPSTDHITFSLESMETLERLSSSLGWTPQIIESARNSIALAIRTISAHPNILKILKQKHKAGSLYSQHISLLSLVTCCIAQQLGWTSQSSQLKLAMASLMHDIAVDDEVYVSLEHWNACSRNYLAKDPDTLRYRNHPIEALTLLRTIKDLPPDIDHIILQHHELPDGTGFPYKLTGGRISPMAAVFIISEDLLTYLEDHDIESGAREFLREREEKYQSGMFKKVFAVLKDNISHFQAAST